MASRDQARAEVLARLRARIDRLYALVVEAPRELDAPTGAGARLRPPGPATPERRPPAGSTAQVSGKPRRRSQHRP